MDLIYDIKQYQENRILLADEVATDPVFTFVVTNPWTGESKTATIPKEGTDGDWVLIIDSVSDLYEDLDQGKIYFDDIGTWTGTLTAGTYYKKIDLQVIKGIDMARIYVVERNITSDEILQLNSTPIELITAPGEGKIISLIMAVYKYTYAVAPYATNTNFRTRYLGGSGIIDNGTSGFINQTSDRIANWTTVNALQTVVPDNSNLPVGIDVATGNPTAGGGSVKVSILYQIIDFSEIT